MNKRLIILLFLFQLIFITPLYSFEYKTSFKDIRIFFNRPDKNPGNDGIENVIIKLIDSAKKEICGAFFEVGRRGVTEALLRAASRLGSENVKIVSHRKYVLGRKLRQYYDDLETAAIIVEYDGKRNGNQGRGLMHNKFMVIDGEIVWTGSMNLTDGNMDRDYNNSLLLKSKELANIYLTEFNEMFDEGKFGKQKFDNTKKDIIIDKIPIEVYFSPSDGVNGKIVEYMDRAQKSIEFVIFTFTSKKIYQALLRARNRGCKIKGYFDNMKNRYSMFDKLIERNFDVKCDKNRRIVHHKYMAIDANTPDGVIITGSHNFTKGANTKNDENTLFIRSSEIAQIYVKELNYLYEGVIPEDNEEKVASKKLSKKELRKKKLALKKLKLEIADKKLELLKKQLTLRKSKKKVASKEKNKKRNRNRRVSKKESGSKTLLKELIIVVDKKADSKFKEYREIKSNYDKLKFYNFSQKNDLMYSMKRCYNDYDIQRKIYNSLLKIYENYKGSSDIVKQYKILEKNLAKNRLILRRNINSKDKKNERKIKLLIGEIETYMSYLIGLFDKLNIDISR